MILISYQFLNSLVNDFAMILKPNLFFLFLNRDFGNKIMPIKPLVPKLPKLLEDRDKQVREEAKQLIIEIYRWIKQAIKPQMSNFNAIQVYFGNQTFKKKHI